MKILITGAAGYIGSMLCSKLVTRGYNVIAIDKITYIPNALNHLFFYKNFKFIKSDVRNKSVLKFYLNNVDFVIPLAALVGAPLCEKNKKLATQVNLNQIKNILSLIKKKQKIIYLNSNSGYGVGEKNKFCDENSPLNPISHYGKTKVQAEKLVIQRKEKNFVCFRLATVFGYSYRMRTDLIVNFFVKESVTKNKITIFEPHFRRNFIHVRDVVNAIIFSIKNFKKLNGEVFNLGLSSANITKIELAKKVKKVNKKTKIKVVHGIKDPDQRDYFVSNKKIEKKGFKAKISLDEGIREVNNVLKLSSNYENNY
jgi:nucleoside-diphosphate-sugar epimerase